MRRDLFGQPRFDPIEPILVKVPGGDRHAGRWEFHHIFIGRVEFWPWRAARGIGIAGFRVLCPIAVRRGSHRLAFLVEGRAARRVEHVREFTAVRESEQGRALRGRGIREVLHIRGVAVLGVQPREIAVGLADR